MHNRISEVKASYETISSHFSKTRHKPWQEFSMFGKYIKDNDKILDLGCGNGRLYKFFTENKLNIDYYGLDLTEKFIEICKETYPMIKDRFIVGDMTEIPYEKEFFNHILAISSFQHLPNKKTRLKALSEMHRTLKKDGYLFMTNWNILNPAFLPYALNLFWKKRSYKDFFIPWKNPQGEIKTQRYYHAFTVREMESLLKKSGFEIIKMFFHGDKYSKKRNLVTIAKKINN